MYVKSLYSRYLIELALRRLGRVPDETDLPIVSIDESASIDLETWHKLKITREDKEPADITRHPRKSKGERKRNRRHLK